MQKAHELRESIRKQALTLGFDAVGFAPATNDTRTKNNLEAYVAAGLHGEMGWMAETIERRKSPDALWADVKTVITLGMNYAPATNALAGLQHLERGNISVYARGRDYHDIMKKRLKQLARWMVEQYANDVKVFVDTAPVMEKPLAAKSGIGWQAKHTNVVSKQFGAWLFLGEVFTTLELPADNPEVDHCGSCTRCLDACPTRALTAPGEIDPRRCISYLTIEAKAQIPEDLRPNIGNRIYGCDDCLAVCPWNKFATPTREAAFLPRAELTAPRLADLCTLDDSAFRAVFAGSPVKRIGRNRFVRNVLLAIGNSATTHLRDCAEKLMTDADPQVAEMARWAITRLSRDKV